MMIPYQVWIVAPKPYTEKAVGGRIYLERQKAEGKRDELNLSYRKHSGSIGPYKVYEAMIKVLGE